MRHQSDFNLDGALAQTEEYQRAYQDAMNGNGYVSDGPSTPEWRDLANGINIDTSRFHCTDLGNGERLIARYGPNLRYCNPWKKFLTWAGTHWSIDDTQQVRQWARATARAIYSEAEALTTLAKGTDDEERRAKLAERAAKLLQHAVKSESEARINAMVNLAQMDVPVLPEQLDANPWLLNVANGTLNLKTGDLHPHCRNDLLTKIIPVAYDPEASCPLWEAFLDSVMKGRQDVVDFLWKAVGYSLTGDTREDCLFLLHGVGANGKSTLLSILRHLLGDYGKQAAFSTFLHQERETIRNDVADLRGARLVVASEADEGKRLSESLIKSLTGRDPMKARFLFQENFEFMPQLKIWLAANHKPVIRGTDHAMWRRIRLVPFDVKFEGEQQDKDLPEKLKAELPGILAWAVRGCLAWQKDGLPLPETVKVATDGYQAEMDTLGNFISACCEVGPYYQVRTSDLYNAYVVWSGDKQIKQNAFGRQLSERGYPLHNQRWRKGLRLLSESEG